MEIRMQKGCREEGLKNRYTGYILWCTDRRGSLRGRNLWGVVGQKERERGSAEVSQWESLTVSSTVAGDSLWDSPQAWPNTSRRVNPIIALPPEHAWEVPFCTLTLIAHNSQQVSLVLTVCVCVCLFFCMAIYFVFIMPTIKQSQRSDSQTLVSWWWVGSKSLLVAVPVCFQWWISSVITNGSCFIIWYSWLRPNTASASWRLLFCHPSLAKSAEAAVAHRSPLSITHGWGFWGRIYWIDAARCKEPSATQRGVGSGSGGILLGMQPVWGFWA